MDSTSMALGTQVPDMTTVMNEAKAMQAMQLQMMMFQARMTKANTMMQGWNNMFNAGIQNITQSLASCRDALQSIGRNM